MGALEVRLLGPLEVRRDGRILKLGGAKPRTLLADLALHLGETVSVDRLIDDLWGERPPARAKHTVQEYVSKLRKELGPELLTRAPGYALELEAERVDLTRFAQRAAEGHALLERDPETAAAVLREALALWHGPVLTEFTFEPFAQIEIARLEELRLQCLEDRIEADLAAGRDADLIPELEALARAEPRREQLRAQLMRALYRSGRAADALAVYRTTRETFAEELGLEPGPELRALEQAILRQDPSLHEPSVRTVESDLVQRKLATVVAIELAEGLEELDAEALHRLASDWQSRTAAVVQRHGGRIESISADEALAVFGVPLAREDDVLRAARASLELRDARFRVGLETGEVVAGGSLVAGPVLSHARGMARAADPGTVVAGDHAAALIAHAARFEPETSRLLELVDDAPAFERRLDAPLVGRSDELASLRQALDEGVRAGACSAVQVVGQPGIGKTRLAREFAAALHERALVLGGACVAEGAGSTYRPLLRIVRACAGAESRDAIFARTNDELVAATLAAALGGEDGTPSAPEVAWAFRRFCEALAAEQPLVLVLDDVQWAEPTLLDLLEQLAARGRGPMLLLCLAREELREDRPSFLDGRGCIVLDALSPEETSALVRQLLGERPFTPDLLERVLGAAEGNPLFLEQLLAFVAEEGALVGRPLPPTIQALLAARLDRLGPGERAVLSRAAVIGREFHLAELEALLEPQFVATVRRHLRTLVGRGFVQAPDDAYRFRHVLVQEAVYRATPKAERAELHEKLADHLAREGERDEIVGFHLERAYRLNVELGTDNRRLLQLASDAGGRLGAAGILAWKRNDVPATVGLLERATDLLDAEAPLARELMCELGLALRAGGEAQRATDALAFAARSAASVGDAHIELRARMELSFVRLLEGPRTSGKEFLEVAQAAIPTFEALKDDRALGRAWLLTGFVHGGRYLRCKAWEDASERALVSYRRAGWPVATCLGQLSQALYQGPRPAPEAAARCELLLLQDAAGPAGEANVLAFLGGLLAMQGRLQDGRVLVARAHEILDELGQFGLAAASCGKVGGAIEFLAGDWHAAELVLLESCERLRSARLNSAFATGAGELAGAIYAQGRYAEADEWARAAESAAAQDDLDARLAWQPVRAKLLAQQGGHDHAQRVASEAVLAAQSTDALNRRARALLDYAEVLRLGGREDDATECTEQARRDYAQKGNRAALEQIAAPVAKA